MENIKFRCETCNNEFSFDESWNSSSPCAIHHNMPYENWNTLDMVCPNCGKRIRKEVVREVIH
jgi:hypothetical protein